MQGENLNLKALWGINISEKENSNPNIGEYKKEGLIYGFGSNMFRLAGSVILYGVVSSYIFGIIRLILGGVYDI